MNFSALVILSQGILSSLIAVLLVSVFSKMRLFFENYKLKQVIGLKPKDSCMVILSKRGEPQLVSHREAYASAYLYSVLNTLKADCEFYLIDEVTEREGDRTEFCLGGAQTNKRIYRYIEYFLPGIKVNIYDDNKRFSLTINDQEYCYDPDKQKDFGLLVKIKQSNKSIFLIVGITGFSLLGVSYYFFSNVKSDIYNMFKNDSFCLLLEWRSPWDLGVKNVFKVHNITNFAFQKISNEIIDKNS